MVFQSFKSIFRVFISSAASLPPFDKDLSKRQPGLSETSEMQLVDVCATLHLNEHRVDWSSMSSSCKHMLSQVLSFPLNCSITVPCPSIVAVFLQSSLLSDSSANFSNSISKISIFSLFFSFHFYFSTPFTLTGSLNTELVVSSWVKIHGPMVVCCGQEHMDDLPAFRTDCF